MPKKKERKISKLEVYAKEIENLRHELDEKDNKIASICQKLARAKELTNQRENEVLLWKNRVAKISGAGLKLEAELVEANKENAQNKPTTKSFRKIVGLKKDVKRLDKENKELMSHNGDLALRLAKLGEVIKKLEAEKAASHLALEKVKENLAHGLVRESQVPYCVELVTRGGARQVQMRVQNETVIDMIYRALLGGKIGNPVDMIYASWDRIELRIVQQN